MEDREAHAHARKRLGTAGSPPFPACCERARGAVRCGRRRLIDLCVCLSAVRCRALSVRSEPWKCRNEKETGNKPPAAPLASSMSAWDPYEWYRLASFLGVPVVVVCDFGLWDTYVGGGTPAVPRTRPPAALALETPKQRPRPHQLSAVSTVCTRQSIGAAKPHAASQIAPRHTLA